jgi:hypothetical protein
MTDCNDIPTPSDLNFSPGELTLYGVPLNKIILDLPQPSGPHEITLPSIGGTVAIAAYGYAYEGHCYRFEKTKIMVFVGGDGKPANGGCGFSGEYKMWRLQPNARIVELSTLAGTVQEVILDAGLPGRRAPATYRGEMQLVHRGGRLTTS